MGKVIKVDFTGGADLIGSVIEIPGMHGWWKVVGPGGECGADWHIEACDENGNILPE